MKNSSAPDSPALLATVDRSGAVESHHFGHVVIVRGDRLERCWGAPDTPVFARSAIKPLQALPLMERGGVDRLGLTDAELAVMSASHNGTEEHLQVVRGLLDKGGFSERDLGCGPHAPFDRAASLAIARAGLKPEVMHNNCSGKHAGFLHLARDLDQPLGSYLDPDGASQRLIRRVVAEMSGVSDDELMVGVDGCGAPTIRLPLRGLATAFCRLVNPDGLPPVRTAACRRLLQAVSRQPVLLAGRGELSTALVESAPGRVYPKNGAEGVYAFGVVGAGGEGYGVAIKVEDGNERGYKPVAIDILTRLGLWPAVPAELEPFARVPVFNTQKILVGCVRSVLAW